MPIISSNVAFHWVKSVSARSTRTSGAPLIIELHGSEMDCEHNTAEITIFTDDQSLTDRLIEAINAVNVPLAEAAE